MLDLANSDARLYGSVSDNAGRSLHTRFLAMAFWPCGPRPKAGSETDAVVAWSGGEELVTSGEMLSEIIGSVKKSRAALYCTRGFWSEHWRQVAFRHEGWPLSVLLPMDDPDELRAALFGDADAVEICTFLERMGEMQREVKGGHLIWTDRRARPRRRS